MRHRAFVPSEDDSKLDAQIGILLRVGTLSSAAVILLGGVLYLVRHGQDRPVYSPFKGVSPQLHTLSGILDGALHGHSLAIIQLGLVMLIATPIARVLFSVVAFLVERDYLYGAISAIVLTVLLISLLWH
jgi:uncharacterized membrane protein